MLDKHDCGKFDKSFMEVRTMKDGSWTLFIEDEPTATIEFCPFCGERLPPSIDEST